MPPDESLIKHFFLFSIFSEFNLLSKKPNCLTSKCEKKFPLRQVISAHAPDRLSLGAPMGDAGSNSTVLCIVLLFPPLSPFKFTDLSVSIKSNANKTKAKQNQT